MLVSDLMTKTPRCCRGSDSLATAAKVLWDGDCGVAPVVDDGGRPIGMITDRDCCMAAYTRGQRLADMSVHSAMAKVVFSVRADQPLGEAMAVMQQHQVRRLPVVDGSGKLCGVLAQADLLLRGGAGGPSAAAIVQTLAATVAPRSGVQRRAEGGAVVVPKPSAGVPAPVAAPAATAAAGKGKGRGKKR